MTVGDAAHFLLENHDGHRRDARGRRRCTSSCRPRSSLEITYTEPGLQGDRSTGGTKPATLETGYDIQVPLFLRPARRSRSTPAPATTSAESADLAKLHRCRTSKARKRAIDVLFEAEQRGLDPVARCSTTDRPGRPARSRRTPWSWSRASSAHRERMDELISTYTESWPLDRMPVGRPERAAARRLRAAFVDEVPDAVALERGGGAGSAAVHRRVARVRQRAAGPAALAEADPEPLTLTLSGPVTRTHAERPPRSSRCVAASVFALRKTSAQ